MPGILLSTLHYFQRIWPALVYGILVGAIVRSMVSPRWVVSFLGRGGAKSTLAGAAAGSPLMLCSCCVTPVFTGVYERGASVGSALSLMLASPGLNIAALALTFVLMPLRFGVLRLLAALIAVLVVAPTIGKLFAGSVRRPPVAAGEVAQPGWRPLVLRFVKNLGYMAVVTLPLIVVGVALSAWLLPYTAQLSAYGATLAVVL